MKVYNGSWCITPLILNLGTGWMWVVNITRPPLYPQDGTPVPTVKGAGWAVGTVSKGAENLVPHWDSIFRPFSSLRVAITTEPSRPTTYTSTHANSYTVSKQTVFQRGFVHGEANFTLQEWCVQLFGESEKFDYAPSAKHALQYRLNKWQYCW